MSASSLGVSDVPNLVVALALAVPALLLLLGLAGFGQVLAGLWAVVSLVAGAVVLYLLYRAVVALERLARAHERLADAREE